MTAYVPALADDIEITASGERGSVVAFRQRRASVGVKVGAMLRWYEPDMLKRAETPQIAVVTTDTQISTEIALDPLNGANSGIVETALPIDVIDIPDDILTVLTDAKEVVSTTRSYFFGGHGEKPGSDPAGVFSQPAHPRIRIPDGVYGVEYVVEVLKRVDVEVFDYLGIEAAYPGGDWLTVYHQQLATSAAEALTDRAMRIVSEAWVMSDVVAGIEAAVEPLDDEIAAAYRKQLARACVVAWRSAA